MDEEKKVITTADFVTRLADKGYTKKDSAVILADVLDVIYEAIRAGEEVKLFGFGSFSVSEYPAKMSHNVATGEMRMTAAHKRIKFKPFLALKYAVDGI